MAVQNFGSAGGGYQLSPGVNVSEIDLTTTTSPISTSAGAFAGVFQWGPVGQRILVTSENELVKYFGKPSSINPETWFTAANFLSYGNALYVSRAANTEVVFSAIAAANASIEAGSGSSYKNRDDYDAKVATTNTNIYYVAKYPGALGNTLKVSECATPESYNSTIQLTVANATVNAVATSNSTTSLGVYLGIGSNTANVSIGVGAGWTPESNSVVASTLDNILSTLKVGDIVEVGNVSIGTQSLKVTNVANAVSRNDGAIVTGANAIISFNQPLKLATAISGANTVTRYWEYYNQVDKAPGTSLFVSQNGNSAAKDEVHVIVVDEDGKLTGAPGQILEVFSGLSRATDAKSADNSTIYYKTVINEQSQYIWVANPTSGTVANAVAANITSLSNSSVFTGSFRSGTDKDESDSGATLAVIAQAYDIFASTEDTDISLIMTGKARGGTNKEQLTNYLIDNIAEVRQDCMVFTSPDYNDVVNQTINTTQNVIDFRNALRSTSYAVMDTGYKYQYDKYNDIYRWIPLNGDIAGICARTDQTRDPWFSPAGTTRGQIRNVVKLAYNPNKAQRDQLYKNGINPVITQPGQGTFLFGDKTLLARASAFDRINVRRLFIVLEKVISNAAKGLLFEFNDEFTRAQFRNLVEPYLRDVQGRRGIYDFKVVCDSTNNTADVVDRNTFVGDIYIKPAKSINYIQLNFVAVRSGVSFSEVVGG